MTTPYKASGDENISCEPTQRQYFRESEEYWFKMLREELDEENITFINGRNLMEKYPYYISSKKFVRFGSGSYQMVWQALKRSRPNNHIAIFNFMTDRRTEDYIRSNLKKNGEYTMIKHRDCERSAEEIVRCIETSQITS